jgi:hypothetical protein
MQDRYRRRDSCHARLSPYVVDVDDFIEQVQDIITVGEFYERAAGGQIIFT